MEEREKREIENTESCSPSRFEILFMSPATAPFSHNSQNTLWFIILHWALLLVLITMEGCGNRVSCRNLFKKLQILPLKSQYMLSLLMFVVQNKTLF